MQQFVIHIDEAGGGAPLVLDVTVASEARAREVARDWLGRSSHHVAARAWSGGEPVFEISGDGD